MYVYKWYIRMHTVHVNTHGVELRFQLQPVPFSHDELWDVEVLVHASGSVAKLGRGMSGQSAANWWKTSLGVARPFSFLVMISSGVMMWTTPPQPLQELGSWNRYQHNPALRHVTASLPRSSKALTGLETGTAKILYASCAVSDLPAC